MDDPAGALWLFFVSFQAEYQLDAGRLDAAERTYLDIHNMLQHHPGSPQQLERLAVSYQQLGRVAQERGLLDEAQQWYLKSLTIREELGNRSGMATSFGQLGLLAKHRGRPEEAMDGRSGAWRSSRSSPTPPPDPVPPS